MDILNWTGRVSVEIDEDIDRANIFTITPCGSRQQIATIHDFTDNGGGIEFHHTLSFSTALDIITIASRLLRGFTPEEYHILTKKS